MIKNKILPLSLTLFFGLIFFIFYKSLDDKNIYVPIINEKKDIPVFNTKDFYSSESLKSSNIFDSNKIYLFNIWSSWCIPCRKEHPFLMRLNLDNKINVIGMNYKDNKKNAKKFLDELGNPYNKILTDLDGTIAIEWGAYGVPESFLIYNNKILKKYTGPLNSKIINEMKLLIK
tara:strand:- start:310 stop:831 length:522 start_codon:yes stop_codon:yes gene_type:complete